MVSLPSTLGSTEARKSVRIASDPMVYAPPIGQFCQEMLGLDVPLIVPLDRAIVPSASFVSWGATTIHYLQVKVTVGTTAATEASFIQKFAIPIKTYDTLPLYRQFNEPICDVQLTDDKQVQVEIVLPVSAVGPQDPMSVGLKILQNPLHRRVSKNLQLKLVTIQLKEVLECFDGGLPARKETKLFTETKEFLSALNTEGISYTFRTLFPYFNDLLDLYSYGRSSDLEKGDVKLAVASFNRNTNFSTLQEGIPLTHVRGFTLVGKLFALRYELIIKIKIAHGKDFEYILPVSVSPFDRASSAYLIDWIKGECLVARELFGKELVAQLANSHSWNMVYRELKRRNPPLSIYYNNKTDWIKLGYNPDAFGRPTIERALSDYID